MNQQHCSKNSMVCWALIILAGLLALWAARALYYRFTRKTTSSAVVTTTPAPVTTTQNSAKPAAVPAAAQEPENKEVSDAILKAYVANKDSKIYSALDGAKANLFVFEYPGFKSAKVPAPHAIAVQDKSVENRNTNPAAFTILQKDVMLPVVSSSPSYREKMSFMSLLDQKGNLAAVLTPQGVTLYDVEKTLEASKAGEQNPVKVLWNVSMDAIKSAVNKPEFVAPTALAWYDNKNTLGLKADGKFIALINFDGSVTPK